MSVRVERLTRPRMRQVLLVALGVAAVASLGMTLLVFRGVRGVYQPRVDDLPDHADAVVVFSGEIRRTQLALQLMDDGIADVLVLSLGQLEPTGGSLCGQSVPFVVLCPTPHEINTRGEASDVRRDGQGERMDVDRRCHG